jgi:hypothetical protein
MIFISAIQHFKGDGKMVERRAPFHHGHRQLAAMSMARNIGVERGLT